MLICILQIFISIAMLVYVIVAVKDIYRTKDEMKQEKGKIWNYGIITAIAMFFGTFGVSDTAISVFFYKTTKLVKDKDIPGTIITAAILPVGVMSLAFLSYIDVDPITLLCCVIAQSLGAVLGVRIISRLNEHMIRWVMGIALLATAVMIIAKLFVLGLASGSMFELSSIKLVIAMLAFFLFGGLNMIGMGATVPDMAVLLLLGMDMKAVFPIVMTGNIISCCFGAYKFIKEEKYTRKAVLGSVAGVAAVLIAVNVVRAMDVSILQIVMIALLVYCACSMFHEERKAKKAVQNK